MRTAIRKPKPRKPVKGMRMFLKQNFSALKNVVKSVIPKPKQWYHSHHEIRSRWLHSLRGSFMPHQGKNEMDRRVKQMASHKCIDPNSWTYPEDHWKQPY